LGKWSEKDLGELDRFLRQDELDKRIDEEFVDAVEQARDDLCFLETIINSIWKVALTELGNINAKDRYREDQDKGLEGAPPPRIADVLLNRQKPTPVGASRDLPKQS
jgi:hypothetical protein